MLEFGPCRLRFPSKPAQLPPPSQPSIQDAKHRSFILQVGLCVFTKEDRPFDFLVRTFSGFHVKPNVLQFASDIAGVARGTGACSTLSTERTSSLVRPLANSTVLISPILDEKILTASATKGGGALVRGNVEKRTGISRPVIKLDLRHCALLGFSCHCSSQGW